MKLARRYLLAIVTLFAVAFAATYAWLGLEGAEAANRAASLQLERAARLTAHTLGARVYDDALADSLGTAGGVRVTLIGPDGRVLGDSEVPATRLPEIESHAAREEVRAALEGRTGTAVRASETVSLALLYVAVPTDRGVLRLAIPEQETLAPVRVAQRVTLVALLGLLLALVPAVRLTRREVDREIESARRTVRRIRGGDLERPRGADATGPLGRAIAGMTDQLRARLDVAQREADDLRALLDGLDDGLAFVGRDGSVRLCNPAFERWAGRRVPADAKIGSLFRTPFVYRAVERAQSGEHVAEEVEAGERTVLVSTRPHRGGALLLLRDHTEIKRLEGVRRDFVANVSHELKTPLTSVVGFAEAISDRELTPEQRRDFGNRILANASRMRHLVDDLLELALAESGRWTPRPESLRISEIAREVWSAMPPETFGELIVEVDEPEPRAFADRDALRQVLRNLLDNAARYSEGSAAVRVSVRAEGDAVRTRVIDQGPGIPSAQLARVFERFYRVDPARSRARGGTGLGLAIVKHLIVAQGGDVGIDSAVGRGTTVWFTLPEAGSRSVTPS